MSTGHHSATRSHGYPLPRLGEVESFRTFMETGWDMPARQAPVVEGVAEASEHHRRRVSDALPARPIVVAAGSAPVRANDSYYDFRPDSDFFWLTGCRAEGAVLVMAPTAGGHHATLFVAPPARPGEAGFFTDAARGELWVGASAGLEDWSRALGIETRALHEFDGVLARLGDGVLFGGSTPGAGALAGRPRDPELCRELADLRMFKDDWEVAQLRRAVDDTVEGFAATTLEIPHAVRRGGERWLQGTFDRHARTVGNGPGYSTIVGSGAHAPTLHWVRCDGQVDDGELLLLDMGVETNAFYTADVTRTLPVNGAFTETQRTVHDLVELAHRAALDAVRPGRRFTDFHHAAMEVIAQGLHDWGLLPVSVDEALSPGGQHYRRYLVCGIGHHLGLDVHDCASSHQEQYQGAEIAEGMVLTVEPGLYFHAFDTTVPPELRGIGVRLEDDLVVTAAGHEVLSGALPIDASGIEEWMRTRR